MYVALLVDATAVDRVDVRQCLDDSQENKRFALLPDFADQHRCCNELARRQHQQRVAHTQPRPTKHIEVLPSLRDNIEQRGPDRPNASSSRISTRSTDTKRRRHQSWRRHRLPP